MKGDKVMFKGFYRSLALPMILFMVLFSLMSCTGGSTIAPAANTLKAEPAANTLEGEITKIDTDGTITVLQENGRAVFIETEADTGIIRNGKAAKVSALKVGDTAWVRYKPDFLPDFRKAIEIRATGKD
jgi:hypothetical protein